MSREEVLQGIPVPAAMCLESGSLNEKGVAWVAELLREFANGSKTSAAVVATNHFEAPNSRILFMGLPMPSEHPNSLAEAIEVACAIACASGFHSYHSAIAYHAEKQITDVVFGCVALGRLAEHFTEMSQRKRNMQLVQVSKTQTKVTTYRKLMPFPKGGVTRPRKKPGQLVRANVCLEMPVELTIDMIVDRKLPDELIGWLESNLREVIGNSPSDGETRPGRRPHDAIFGARNKKACRGVNMRNDEPRLDNCAEFNAVATAHTLGIGNELALCAVYSPGYDLPGELWTCPRCYDAIWNAVDAQIGDAVVVYFEKARGQYTVHNLSAMQNRNYGRRAS